MMAGMEDEAFAEELLSILTNPHPAGTGPDDPDGEPEDGIDRHDGFGRDVWVASLEVANGLHGAELVVEFGLALPSGPGFTDVPPFGTVRLPFDAQWRELSGYLVPAAYAPAVAREVETAAYRHAERYRHHPAGQPESDRGQAVVSSRDARWRLLLDALGHRGPAREVAPGRIELRQSGVVVTVVISADEWDRVLTDHACGDVDLYFAELLGPRARDETFVVFYSGDLARSTREKLPPVRSRAWARTIEQARADDPAARFGWVGSPADGSGGPPRA